MDSFQHLIDLVKGEEDARGYILLAYGLLE